MKKVLKYIGIGLGSLMLLGIIAVAGLYFYYRDWAQFHQYLIHNDRVAMQQMLDEGYNINKTVIYYNPNHLQVAIAGSHVVTIETIKFLIKNGININYAAARGATPLITTMVVRRPDIAKILVDRGAKLDVTFNNRTLTEMAIISNFPELIMLIPEDKISVGTDFKKESYLTERVLNFYNEGKTDRRVINYLEKNNLLSK